MTTNLETRLRSHFAGERFRPRPGWGPRVLRMVDLSSAPAPAGRVPALAGRRGPLLAVAALAVLAVVVAITALPVAAGPDTPPWAANLRSAVHIDATGGGRATSWGATMEVVGAYLDDRRTIVVLKGSDAHMLPNVDMVAGGHRHNMQQAVTGGDGYYAVKFEPLPQALSSSVPVTLHLADGAVLPPHFWTLAFTIGPRTAESRSVPEPGQAGSMTITFTSVSAVAGAFAVGFTETGIPYDEVLGPVHTNTDRVRGITMTSRGPGTVRMQVFDGSGRSLRWLDTDLRPAVDGSASVSFSYVSLRTGPGPYRIVIVAPDGRKLERTVDV